MHVMSLISPRTAVLIKPRNVSSHQTRWWFSSEIKTERVSVSLLFAGDQTLRVRLHQTIYSVDSSTATWETESAGKPVPTSANIWALVLRRRAALASLLARVLLLLVSSEEHSSHFLFKLKHPSYFICENHSNSRKTWKTTGWYKETNNWDVSYKRQTAFIYTVKYLKTWCLFVRFYILIWTKSCQNRKDISWKRFYFILCFIVIFKHLLWLFFDYFKFIKNSKLNIKTI